MDRRCHRAWALTTSCRWSCVRREVEAIRFIKSSVRKFYNRLVAAISEVRRCLRGMRLDIESK